MSTSMWRRIGLLLLLLLLAKPSAAAQADIFPVLGGAYVGLGVWDGYTTVQCSKLGTCHEANPLLRPFVDEHGIAPVMTAKVAFQVGTLALLCHWRKDHPRETMAALLSLIVLQSYVNIRNARTLRGVSR